MGWLAGYVVGLVLVFVCLIGSALDERRTLLETG